MHIDLSSESKKHNFLTQYHIDEMKMKNQSQNSLVQKLEYELKSLREENSNIRNENIKLNSEIFNKDQAFNQLNEELKKTQLETEKIISGLRQSLDEKDQKIEKISNTCKLLELELEESRKGISSQHINLREQLSNSEILHNNLELENSLLQHNLINTSYTLKSKKILHEKDPELQMILDTMSYKNRREFLEKKFNCAKYNDSYIIKCLQRDILDFREYNKDQIQKIKPIQEELVFLIQEAVEEVLPDYEVKLYGSHATGLCLTWSDLDTVLVHRKGLGNVSYGNLQHLYIKLLDKPWKKTIKYVESAVVPIIKITTTEKYNSMQIDISIQDMKHYGLKCVDLVKEFMNSYEALEPLLFSLKNILKNANLNDPYTGGMSSYGLILMLVSFLQNQSDNKKSIKPNENNLGRLFLEFLWYYGLMFDHSKYVINTYRPNENDKDMNFVYVRGF